jgi:membrane-associated phospholipid phosphatase
VENGGAPVVDEATAVRRFGSRALVVFGVAFVAAVLFAMVVSLVVASSPTVLRIDRTTADELHEFAVSHRGWTTTMKIISDVGSPVAWWIILGAVVGWLLYRHLRRLAVFVVVTAAGSSLLNGLIKTAVGRARPHLTDPVAIAAGKSFPSGHAQSALVGYGLLLLVFLPVIPRRGRPWAIAAASLTVLAIGFSRIALGVHYLSDVVGAYLVGTVWLLGLAAAFRAWRRDEGHPAAPIGDGLEPEDSSQLKP